MIMSKFYILSILFYFIFDLILVNLDIAILLIAFSISDLDKSIFFELEISSIGSFPSLVIHLCFLISAIVKRLPGSLLKIPFSKSIKSGFKSDL